MDVAMESKDERKEEEEDGKAAERRESAWGGLEIAAGAECAPGWPSVDEWLAGVPSSALPAAGLLAQWNAHPRDRLILFDERPHKYYVYGCRQTISVTGLVHRCFPPFDANVAHDKMIHGRKWKPDHPQWGRTKAEILADWEENRNNAASLGTKMHAAIEYYYNAVGTGMPRDEAARKYDCEGPEWQQFLTFDRDVVQAKGWRPFRTEWRLFDAAHGLSGTIDMLFVEGGAPSPCPSPATAAPSDPVPMEIDSKDAKSVTREGQGEGAPPSPFACAPFHEPLEVIMLDWKRCKELKKENGYDHACAPAIEWMDDCNFWHYSVQLNVYKRMLEKLYGVRVLEMMLGVFHPNQPTFATYPIAPLRARVVDDVMHWALLGDGASRSSH